MERVGKLICSKCCFCFNTKVKSDDQLCEESPKDIKKSKSTGLFSCFTVQEDEFDIINTHEIPTSTFENIINHTQSMGTQTEENKKSQNTQYDDKNDDTYNDKNKFENDFIITDSDLEKN
jgi:hypothetical protein